MPLSSHHPNLPPYLPSSIRLLSPYTIITHDCITMIVYIQRSSNKFLQVGSSSLISLAACKLKLSLFITEKAFVIKISEESVSTLIAMHG